MNKAVIEKIKPGVVYKELNAWSKDLIAEECIKLGIIKEKEEVSKYYWHSIGHNLGLDTHDLEPQGREFVFEKEWYLQLNLEFIFQKKGLELE